MPATRFPAPGAASGSIQWNTYSTTVTGSSSGTTVTLSNSPNTQWRGLTPAITNGTGQFAPNTTIISTSSVPPILATNSLYFNGAGGGYHLALQALLIFYIMAQQIIL